MFHNYKLVMVGKLLTSGPLVAKPSASVLVINLIK